MEHLVIRPFFFISSSVLLLIFFLIGFKTRNYESLVLGLCQDLVRGQLQNPLTGSPLLVAMQTSIHM